MNNLRTLNPVFWIACLSFVLSMALSFHDVVNSDGILYLNVAREFSQAHFAEGLAMYGWAFYPALIAGVNYLTTLTLEHSAILLDAFFMAFMASGFVALVRVMGGNKTVQWVAALVFIVHPGINGYREYIIRDFGAWATLIWSLVILCQYSIKPTWMGVIGWTLTTTLCVLFRPEAVVWLLLAPSALLFTMKSMPMKMRCKAILKLKTLFIVAIISGVLAVILMSITVPFTKLHYMLATYTQTLASGLHVYAGKAQAFSELMSIYFKFDHAVVVLAAALIFYGVFLILKLLSPLYVVLLGYGIYKRPILQKPEALILLWMLVIYAVIYFVFLLNHYFISSRYLIPWVTVAMVWVPFVLVKLWSRAPGALKVTLGLILVYMLLDGVISLGYSKMYLKDAGLWIQNNTPANARLYTNSNHVAYYADRPQVESINEADVIAMRYGKKRPHALNELIAFSSSPHTDFHNKRHDGVTVVVKE